MTRFFPTLAVALARPGLILCLLAVAGLALLLARRRGARPLLTLGVGGLALLLLLPVSQWAARPLENWYPQLRPEPAHIDGIVILGGATRLSASRDRNTPGLNLDGERMTAFMALARRHPEARLVFTGGAERDGWTEADAARLLFDAFGLSARMVYEDRSQDTWENAVFARAVAHPAPGETWVLVTSALHMPRSVAAFRAAGWPVLPAPVAYRTGLPSRDWPSADLGDRISLLDIAAHEWIGLAAYWLRGRAALDDAPG